MSDKQLFRKSALDKLASPEQLDQLMQVTSPKGWIALWTVGGILLMIIIWSIFGSIPTRVDGEGILIRGGDLREFEANGSGVIVSLAIQVNEPVKAGQVIASIDQPDLEDRIATARREYEERQRETESVKLEDGATIAGLRATISGHQADVKRTQSELEKVELELEIKRESYEKGLITRAKVLALERDKVNLEANVTRVKAMVTNVRAQIRQVEQRTRSREIDVESARRRWEELSNRSERISNVTATAEGRIVELKKTVGDQVSHGEVIAIVEPLSSEMQPVLYVTSTQGKQIQQGMEAEIAPSTVKKEEYGFMKAVVGYVGDFPVTFEGVASRVANRDLAEELLSSGSKIEVRANLVPNADTPSGFQWSSSHGPPFMIASGTRVTVSVVVSSKAPYTYILPVIKSTLGVS